jgi:selenocysteine-specific elongation factor
MHVLATAGHVDHGKSTLVRALTGMEPDRWAEERRRGMTIDLGYAWTTLPNGAELAFVDVPGHERFIGNMLAGLGPAPGVLFVVAADEGWSRQSEEHLAAVHALDLRRGLLAVTRSDLADPSPAREQALERIRHSSLGDVACAVVSAPTGQGLDALRAALTDLVATFPAADPTARVRLWIDRAFSVRGSGTVVTGTLGAGTVAVGDELLLGDRSVVVRGVQALGRARDRVTAVARVALNLRGVGTDDVARGDVLLTPGRWHRTRTVDVRLDRSDDVPAELVLHIGTASQPVHVRPLDAGIVRLTLARELPLFAGDRGVLHDTSRHAVAAGVLVLDADPAPLSRRGAARERARQLQHGPPSVQAEINRRGAVRRDELVALGLRPDPGQPVVAGWLVSPAIWQRWVSAVPTIVAGWAQRHPLEPAMPLPALRRQLELPDNALLAPVLAAAGLSSGHGRVAVTSASLGPAEPGVQALEARLAEEPFRAPERAELAELGLGHRELAAAQRADRVLRINDDVVLLPSAPESAAEILRSLTQPFTISQARQALGTSRRVAVPLLEHLDRLGLTERVDEQRRRAIGYHWKT